ncbi:MAG: hypothetical protein JNL40_15720 [Cyclobacteriaceae bacterium]|nr:hypothetical protein [Cyclobacteriaceae bacterium]
MRLLFTFILVSICFTVMAQASAERKWVDSEVRYTDAAGKSVMVHSSLPKGGSVYTDSIGKKYGYVIFWFRVINESSAPLALSIRLPAEPFTIFPSPDSHIRLFVPPDTMMQDKISLNDYGLDLQSFLATGFNKPSVLDKTVLPKNECFFYVPVLFYQARGTTRAALVLKGKDLFFKISVAPDVDSVLIPCGKLVFGN